MLLTLPKFLRSFSFRFWLWRLSYNWQRQPKPSWPASNTQRYQLWRKRQRYHQHYKLMQPVAIYRD